MTKPTLSGPAEVALHQLQDTKLSPMEEALFQAWTKANQVKKPDSADDPIDYRGIYRLTGGKILPYGQLNQIAKQTAGVMKLKQSVQDQMANAKEDASNRMDQLHKEQRQDVTHQQRMQQEQMKLAKAPYDLQSQQAKNQGKAIDVEGKRAAAETQKYKTNERLIEALIPRTEPMMETPDASGQTGSPTSEPSADTL